MAGRALGRAALHHLVHRPDRHAPGQAGGTSRGDLRAAAPVVVCADADEVGGGRHRPVLFRLRAHLRRHAAGHLVERIGLRHALLVARPADQDLSLIHI